MVEPTSLLAFKAERELAEARKREAQHSELLRLTQLARHVSIEQGTVAAIVFLRNALSAWTKEAPYTVEDVERHHLGELP